jgi:hypothetical protein
MSFLSSPGVEINEIDRTDSIPALSTSVGGYAGDFNWGPHEQVISISNERELVSIFGAPSLDKSNASSFLTAASFLKYGQGLRVVRTLNDGANTARLATNDVNLTTIYNFKNSEEFESITNLPSTIFARYPGDLGNSIVVKIATGDTALSEYNTHFAKYFDYQPNKTDYAETLGNSNISDEIHILIIDELGKISGIPGNVLEKYQGLSLLRDAKSENGSSLWYGDVINRGSSYIYISSLDFIFNNADSILQDNPSVIITRNGNANVSQATVPITTSVSVENTGIIGTGTGVVTVNSGSTTVNKTVKIGILFNKTGYTNLSGNACRLILVSDENFAVNFPGVTTPDTEIIIHNGTSSNFAMDVKLTYSPTHTITQIIHELNTVEENIYVDSGVNKRIWTFTAYIDNLYQIASNDVIGVDAPGQLTTIRDNLGNVINVETNPSAKTHQNLKPTYALNSTNIFNFSGAIIGDGTLLTYGLAGGLNRASGTTSTLASDVVTALEVIEYIDRDLLDINYLFAQQIPDDTTIDNKIHSLVESRRDIMGFISAPVGISTMSSNAAKKQAVITKFSNIPSSSFLVFDSTPVYVYNRYQDNYIWIPACGHMAGLCANTDLVAEPWFSPAGFNRGQLRGVTKIALNPTQIDRDDLYKNRINPIVSFPGQGIVLFGDKTAVSKSSAFDRINVRRLFNVVERAIKQYSKSQLFELNDEFTRNAFVATIDPFLRDIKGRRGIIDYKIVCDATNNTSAVIDGNRFVGDIYIKPVKSINYISLNFIATRTGVAFSEIVG